MLHRMRAPSRPLAAVAALLTSLSPVAFADDWYVDVNYVDCATGDGSEANPFCNIGDAIAAAADGDTVHIAPGTYYENLIIDKDVTLQGTSGFDQTIVDGALLDRVALVTQDSSVSIMGMTLINGTASEGGVIKVDDSCNLALDSSLAMYGFSTDGAGIHNSGELLLTNTTVQCAYSDSDGGGIWNGGVCELVNSLVYWTASVGTGGGICNDGDLTLRDSRVDLTFGQGDGAGVWTNDTLNVLRSEVSRGYTEYGSGGNIYVSNGVATITNSTISSGTSLTFFGGGILNGGSLTICDSVMTGNWAYYRGGGISNFGDLTVNNTLISNSFTWYDGGAIDNGGLNATASLQMLNTTLSGNVANRGGGVYNGKYGTAYLTNCTVADNDAIEVEFTCGLGGGILDREGGQVVLGATIIAGNRDGCGAPDCSGTIESSGFNLIGDTTGCTTTGDETGNIYNVEPLLDVLADNGGPTMTHGLLPGSPAIDAGNPNDFLQTDQRGVPRFLPDIGAYERSLALNVTPNDLNVGDNADILTFEGVPGSLALLVAVELNDSPFFYRLSVGALDGKGEWLQSVSVPAGLEGTNIMLQSIGYEEGGSAAVTNGEQVSIE